MTILKINKKILSDIMLSIMSSIIPIFILQFFILPLVSMRLGDSDYGIVVTIISYINVLPSAMGNVLNNIRLIRNNEYIQKNIEGDFNVIFCATCLVNIVALLIFVNVYNFEISVSTWLLICFLSFLVSGYEYYNVVFRITLDYKSTFICNLSLSVGYCIGYVIFFFTNMWPSIYACGYLLALAYIFFKSNFWREKYCITEMFKGTLIESTTLFIAGLISRLINYADKLLIYPVLGGEEVAVYYAASIIGKMISMLISPISNVVLSYLAKMKRKKDNIFWMVLAVVGCIGVVGYFICVFLSKYILLIIYPQYMDRALNYIPITTATAVTTAIIGIMNPFVLKFVDMKWQIVINSMTLAAYVIMSLGLLNNIGMIGFCWGVFAANLLKLILVIMIYIKESRKQNVDKE